MAVRGFSRSSIIQNSPKGQNFAYIANFPVDFLVISGGGGGRPGNNPSYNGGGGYGTGYRASTGGNTYRDGFVEPSVAIVAGVSYTVTVGAGGASDTAGSDSVFSTVTSTGSPKGDAAQAGGDGAGADNSGGTGGLGLANTITGVSVRRCGGGGAGGQPAFAGSDGGGSGTDNGNGSPGTANTGSGGGGTRSATGGTQGLQGGAGGSGVVILSYPSSRTLTVGAGLTANTTQLVGINKVTTFTAGTGTVTFA